MRDFAQPVRNKIDYRLYFLLSILLTLSILFGGCSLVKKVAGADIDAEQFAKAREAKMYEIKSLSSAKLAARLGKSDPVDNAEIVIYLNETLLNKILNQYETTSGWLDESTSFVVQTIDLSLENGCAIASINMTAHNDSYSVDVLLALDCILTIEMKNNELRINLEPFNISPVASAEGLLSSTDEIIENLIKINLAKAAENFPKLKIPVDFSNKFTIKETSALVKAQINLSINSPERNINYSFKLKEILFFKDIVLVALNIDNIVVK